MTTIKRTYIPSLSFLKTNQFNHRKLNVFFNDDVKFSDIFNNIIYRHDPSTGKMVIIAFEMNNIEKYLIDKNPINSSNIDDVYVQHISSSKNTMNIIIEDCKQMCDKIYNIDDYYNFRNLNSHQTKVFSTLDINRFKGYVIWYCANYILFIGLQERRSRRDAPGYDRQPAREHYQ